jgi:hypothetical protein
MFNGVGASVLQSYCSLGVRELIRRTMALPIELLWGGVGFFQGAGSVSRAQ